jgi:phage tail sheath protein FI
MQSEAIACATRCRSSRLGGWRTIKKNQKKWRVKKEERHKGVADHTLTRVARWYIFKPKIPI